MAGLGSFTSGHIFLMPVIIKTKCISDNEAFYGNTPKYIFIRAITSNGYG